ncbi:BZ3500_MvSof-1268-A1-R1_Chr4-2g07198 [Microbotryum saponariae]|uniref:BZ3500_MvSof-1268-A1-R1_Chr4-2g07198 protein n=1 Tax=Microbotryum saponariae TaxID=289078 RepID=A0A2X0LMG5_9BASI|nr:BZ3500_MvSof-1268-A1-R1_Chr4-2g07198 [Microbotryum saponariae]
MIFGSTESPTPTELPSQSTSSSPAAPSSPVASSSHSHSHPHPHPHSYSNSQTAAPTVAAPSYASSNAHVPISTTLDQHAPLTDHLFIAGWTNALFSDTQLTVNYAAMRHSPSTFHLHAIIVSQSPLLRSQLSPETRLEINYPHRPLHLNSPDPEIDPESVSLVLASLYNLSILTAHLEAKNAVSVLAVAYWLGLDSVLKRAEEQCRTSIRFVKSKHDFANWYRALGILSGSEADDAPSSHGHHYQHHHHTSSPGAGVGSSSDRSESRASLASSNGVPFTGLASPMDPNTSFPHGSDGASRLNGHANANGGAANGSGSAQLKYGAAGARLKVELGRRLLDLPNELNAFPPAGSSSTGGYDELVDLMTSLPFEVLKTALESTSFKIPGGDLQRFSLGQKIVAARRSFAASAGRPPVWEENVVLQFGANGTSSSAVGLLRKRKVRGSWKVSDSS